MSTAPRAPHFQALSLPRLIPPEVKWLPSGTEEQGPLPTRLLEMMGTHVASAQGAEEV